MLDMKEINKMEVKIPAKPVKEVKSMFKVTGIDGVNDINFIEKEVAINEYDTEKRRYYSFKVYGVFLPETAEQTQSHETFIEVSGLERDDKSAENAWAETILKIQKAASDVLLVLPRFIRYVEGEPIAVGYTNDFEPASKADLK